MEVVGRIQGYEVIYIPEKQLVFCKNTAIPLKIITEILKSGNQKNYIPAKKLWINKGNDIITFGCLTTTINNINTIHKKIKKCQMT